MEEEEGGKRKRRREGRTEGEGETGGGGGGGGRGDGGGGGAVFSPGCSRISGQYPFQSESISATIASNLKAYQLLCFCVAFH